MTNEEILNAVMTTSEVERYAGLARGTALKAAQEHRVAARYIPGYLEREHGDRKPRAGTWLILRADAERLWPKLIIQRREEWPEEDGDLSDILA